MKKKLVSILLVSMMTASVLTGCGSKQGLEGKSKAELIEMYNNAASLANQLDTMYNDLQNQYTAVTGDLEYSPSIGMVGDGSNRLAFKSHDQKIIFNSAFTYPGATTLNCTDAILLTDNVTITPNSNWVVKLNGNAIEFEHTNGISGIVKVGLQGEFIDPSILTTQVIQPWFESSKAVNSESVKYTNIYNENDVNPCGVNACAPILIQTDDAYLRCGMYSCGTHTITYSFTYRSAYDTTKDEAIISLLNTLNVDNKKLKLTQ